MNDYILTLPTESTNSITPVGSIVFSSDDDVPLSSGQEDRRKVRRREVGENDRPGPNEVPEYVPKPREEPVDIPIYKPTPRDRPVDGQIIGVRPAVHQMYSPIHAEGEYPSALCFFEVRGRAPTRNVRNTHAWSAHFRRSSYTELAPRRAESVTLSDSHIICQFYKINQAHFDV